MCGIAGIINLRPGAPVKERDITRMLAPLAVRGPDGTGCYRDPSGLVGLGHTRLAIIDLEGGAQPIGNEDDSIQVVFNGEIFNYLELRADLEHSGHRFRTRTDTEVLVHLYEEHGLDFVGHLNGQFALALWDSRRRRLVLARDRPGILPLFYSREGDRLLFASEVKSLLLGLANLPAPDLAALDQVFTFWSPVGESTMFEGVRQLPPGHLLVVEDGHARLKRYWDWEFREPGDYLAGTVPELAEQLHALLLDATRLRLRADVPVGAYLSGGLDSSAIIALVKEAGTIPQAFCLAFDDPTLDESGFQREAAAHLGVAASTLRVDAATMQAGLEQAVWRAETPFLRAAPVPMLSLSGLVRQQGFKVVLTGEGADEVFGGYDIFKEAKVRRFWARQPGSTLRPALLRRLYPYLDITGKRGQAYSEAFFGAGLGDPDSPFFAHEPRWRVTSQAKAFFSDGTRERLGESDAIDALASRLPERFHAWDPFNQAQYIEATTLLPGYLLSTQADRMLMANGVEGRFPYLDHRVIEFANALDPRLKMRVLQEKYLLKKAVGRSLPRSVLHRPKQPYRSPDVHHLGKPGIPFVEEALSESALRRAGYFDPARARLLVRKVQAGRALGARDAMAFVGMLTTQRWHRQFVDNVLPGDGGKE